MLYRIVRPLAALSLRAYYRKIYLTHAERIPKGKPVILASNHPTAFLEPCILACFLDRPLYFLVRGDLFKKPFYASLLRGLHMLPVFRLKDGGYGKLKDNYSTFEACHTALAERKTIMILAEGNTIQEKRLRPLQKGAARIALGTLDAQPQVEEAFIVPVGVNFTYANRPRTEVYIDFGEPIPVSTHLAEFRENNNQAMAALTEVLRGGMEQHIIIVARKEDDELAEYLFQLYRTGHPNAALPIVSDTGSPLYPEKAIAATINELSGEKRRELLSLSRDYFQALGAHALDDRAAGGRNYATAVNAILLVLGFPFFLTGYLWNYLPARLGKNVSDTKVKTLEFKSPVRWAATLGAYLAYVLLWLLIAAIAGHWAIGLVVIVVLVFLGHSSYYYREFAERFRMSRAFGRLDAGQQSELQDKRAAVLAAFRGMGGHI
ncbi:MAG: 1-acyl-sn-glycerol-3-phosphate acyltransferase [Phaeodactylibacter sp.]|nr:1-acyl-sn-glycerol-3-phosphate acyltransferase [Phaeodactylibacter sp.]MCB9274911.1 1-acyl-sn-glycerol-3-phosphate acyltransferase [Lewinellaceae bacterium]